MFSFYPSHPRALRYSAPVYSVYDTDFYSPYQLSSRDSRVPVANPDVRYRRAISEYVAAEEEYNAVLRRHEEARLMKARAEAIRQERVRLRLEQLARARREREQQFKQGLAKALVRAAVSGDDDLLHHVVPVTVRPLSHMLIPSCMHGEVSCADGASVQKERAQRDAKEETSVNQSPLSASKPGECECAAPNLESVLRERLQKIAGDEEVQDLARSILRHLTSATGVSTSAAASSPELNASTEPDEGAHLSRSHALKGATAEAAKASFKAHRAEVAEKSELSPTSPTSTTAPSSLAIIEDIRSALTKLSAGFSLPPSLDFSDDEPDGLAYTPTNAPVRVYEHALNRLLEQLDAVESDGDEEVRVVRRAAVKEVEKTIEDVEKRVREAKESARAGGIAGSAGSAVSAEADLTEGKNVDGAVDGKHSVDNDKPEAEKALSNSDDSVDSAPSGLEILPIPNAEVTQPKPAEPTDSKSVQDDDILKDQSPTPFSWSDVPAPALCPLLPYPNGNKAERAVSTDDVSESPFDSEVFDEQATTDQITPVPSEPKILITPPDSPVEVSVPMRGAIAPSSTPIASLVPSIIPDELPASLSCDGLPNSLGEDDAEVGAGDDDGDGEWTEI